MQALVRYIGIFIAFAIGAFAVFGCAWSDLFFTSNFGESSFVEVAQEVLIGLSAVITFYLAYCRKNTAYVLIAGFFTCMFIRELDAVFDQIFHGSWAYLAIAVAISCVYFAIKKTGFKNLVNALGEVVSTRPFVAVLLGMVCVLVFSRLFGIGYIWLTILGDGYVREAKNFAEETCELFGYMQIFLGLIWSVFTSKKPQSS